MSPRPTVYVVDDDENLRRAVVWLLESVGHRVKAYGSAEEALPEVRHDTFGCMLTDMRMAQKSGLHLLEVIREENEAFPVIVMTAFGTVKSSVRAMKLGALDFIEKPFDDQQLLDLINSALELARSRRKEQVRRRNLINGVKNLSPREGSVMDKIIQGKKNREIAAELNIGVKTVETYRSRILSKTGFDSINNLCLHIDKYGISITR